MFKFPIEIQIRTQEMDSIAEYGVAAHFAYSDNNGPTAISHNQSQWIQKLQELVDTYQNSEDKESFKDELNIEVLSKNIFVYTPKGDIIEMPLGSTVLDFAFRIHSDVGLKFKNALVNGNIRPISYKLRTGDIIQIMTYKNKITASKYRVDFLMTPSGKTRLLRYFHQLEKESHLSEAKRRINEKLDYYNLPKLYSEKDQISKHLEEAELERLLLKVLDNQEPMSRIIRKYYPKIITETLKSTKKQTKKTIAATDEIIIDEDKKLGVLICPECKPKI
jgi:(p)ppGpp synthase/HD superfamily hydrolase